MKTVLSINSQGTRQISYSTFEPPQRLFYLTLWNNIAIFPKNFLHFAIIITINLHIHIYFIFLFHYLQVVFFFVYCQASQSPYLVTSANLNYLHNSIVFDPVVLLYLVDYRYFNFYESVSSVYLVLLVFFFLEFFNRLCICSFSLSNFIKEDF